MEPELIAVLEANKKLLDAIVTGDWATYTALVSEDLTCFEPEAGSHLVGGLDFHRFYFPQDPASPPESVKSRKTTTLVQPFVRFLSADRTAALCAYVRLTQALDANGKPVVSEISETRIWARSTTNSQWRNIHFQRGVGKLSQREKGKYDCFLCSKMNSNESSETTGTSAAIDLHDAYPPLWLEYSFEESITKLTSAVSSPPIPIPIPIPIINTALLLNSISAAPPFLLRSDAVPFVHPNGKGWNELDPAAWVEKLTQLLNEALPNASKVILNGDTITDVIPDGYVLFSQMRASQRLFDRYLFGHPSGSRFRSPNEFLPHLVYLYETSLHQNAIANIICKCKNCNQRPLRKSKKEPLNTRDPVELPSNQDIKQDIKQDVTKGEIKTPNLPVRSRRNISNLTSPETLKSAAKRYPLRRSTPRLKQQQLETELTPPLERSDSIAGTPPIDGDASHDINEKTINTESEVCKTITTATTKTKTAAAAAAAAVEINVKTEFSTATDKFFKTNHVTHDFVDSNSELSDSGNFVIFLDMTDDVDYLDDNTENKKIVSYASDNFDSLEEVTNAKDKDDDDIFACILPPKVTKDVVGSQTRTAEMNKAVLSVWDDDDDGYDDSSTSDYEQEKTKSKKHHRRRHNQSISESNQKSKKPKHYHGKNTISFRNSSSGSSILSVSSVANFRIENNHLLPSLENLLEATTVRPEFQTLIYYIKERWKIQQKRAKNTPPPWTSDPIFNDNRFCCIRREDDATSKYLITNIFTVSINPRTDSAYLFNVWFHRYLSNIAAISDVGYVTSLAQVERKLREWKRVGFMYRPKVFISSASDQSVLQAVRSNWQVSQEHSCRIFGGCFKSNDGGSDGELVVLDQVVDENEWTMEGLILANTAVHVPAVTKREFFEFAHRNLELCGRFHAFQESNDAVMYGAIPDDPAFCANGPGSKAGLFLLGLPPTEEAAVALTAKINKYFGREGSNLAQLEAASGVTYSGIPELRVLDTEHTLCEFQKYYRFLQMGKYSGKKLRQQQK
ncbi:hypothetical protein HK100_005454 [Physocladia obscura]|uniref:Cryptic loci regulator 2 N-terminal domain-containing protein n=1 Tax=Physocladia obscura TaxID=109957 RepID=A0AAD5XGF6_9FUNG|nr:hypothetical protein HK100_005454 [Physocladia obscura]